MNTLRLCIPQRMNQSILWLSDSFLHSVSVYSWSPQDVTILGTSNFFLQCQHQNNFFFGNTLSYAKAEISLKLPFHCLQRMYPCDFSDFSFRKTIRTTFLSSARQSRKPQPRVQLKICCRYSWSPATDTDFSSPLWIFMSPRERTIKFLISSLLLFDKGNIT